MSPAEPLVKHIELSLPGHLVLSITACNNQLSVILLQPMTYYI